MKRVIHPFISDGYHMNPRYMAVLVIRHNIKGARREEHTFYADATADLWTHAIDFLNEGFSVISCDLWTVE